MAIPKIFLLLASLAVIVRPVLASSRSWNFPFDLDCVALLPEEPCFQHDCYAHKARRRDNTNSTLESALPVHGDHARAETSLGLDIGKFLDVPCEVFADIDEGRYQRCMAMRYDPDAFIAMTLPHFHLDPDIANSESSTVITPDVAIGSNTTAASQGTQTHTISPRQFWSPDCCMFTFACYDYLDARDDDPHKVYDMVKDQKDWDGIHCCFALWGSSCGGKKKKVPGMIYPPPRCTEPDPYAK